jgi:hypothetical protein
MFLCFYGNVLVTSLTVILRPLDYGTATRGNPGLRETGVFIPPANAGCGRCNVQKKKRKSWLLFMLIHKFVLFGSHMKQVSLKLQSSVHNTSRCIFFQIELLQSLQTGGNNLSLQFCGLLPQKHVNNLTVYVMYCGLKRQHLLEVKLTISTSYINGNWRTIILFDALHFNTGFESTFLPES